MTSPPPLPHVEEGAASARGASRREFWAGVRAQVPLLVGGIPFGMIYGALALKAGLDPFAAQAMSAVIFAGSAQFVTTQLLTHGTPGLVIILTVAVVNLRHLLYSASAAPYLKNLPLRWKAMLGYLLTDEAYVIAIHRLTAPPQENSHWFFLGNGLAEWSSWQLSTLAGIFLGPVIPAEWSLDFTLALTFIALVVPSLKDRAVLASALAAGITALLAYAMPLRLGMITAALVGVAAGLLMEGRK